MAHKQLVLFVALAAFATPVFAVDTNAVIGGALGGGTGAAVGSAIGGRDGALIGGALGGAAGAAIATSGSKETKVVTRFWILGGLFAILALSPLHAYFSSAVTRHGGLEQSLLAGGLLLWDVWLIGGRRRWLWAWTSLAGVALYRGEAINSAWLVLPAVCTYLAAYRFYGAFIAAKRQAG